MKAFLTLFTGLLLIIPAHNVNAQASRLPIPDKDRFYSINESQSDQYLLNGRERLSHVLSMGKVMAGQRIAGTLSKRQAQSFEGLGKTNDQVYLPDSLTLFSMSDTICMSASYDQRGWITQILVQVLSGGHWVNYSRTTWTYLDQNASNLTLEQSWSDGQWINVELDSSTYDAHDNMLVHLFKYWSQGVWKDSILSSRTYDIHGAMLSNTGWYMIGDQWTNNDRTTYMNDTSGNMLSSLLEWWIGGVWVNQNLFTYTYDGDGRVLTRMMQQWNGQWENATLSTYTYDADGNLQSYLFQISAGGQWTNSTLNTYTYDDNGQMLTDWYKGWTNESWMNGTLSTYTYDPSSNMVSALIQEWLNGLWTNYRQSIFTYDAHRNELSGNNTIWSGSSWVPADYDFSLAISGSSYHFTGYRISVSYIPINISGVSEDNNSIVEGYSLFQNYPNPFNPSTTITFTLSERSFVTLKIYDALGRVVSKVISEEMLPGRYARQWNAEGVASGTYFYRLDAGSYSETKKLILLK